MKFSINVDALYLGKDINEALVELGEAGFKDIEFWCWWDKDLARLKELKEKYQFNYTGICTKFLSMVDPADHDEYLDGFRETIGICQDLAIGSIIVKPLDATTAPFWDQYNYMVSLMKEMGALLEGTGITLLLEPVSWLEAPHTFLGTSDLGFQIIKAVDHPQVKLLYDIYHMQLDEGDVVRKILANLPYVGHIHTAGVTDRHELYDGELNYKYIFETIEAAGYTGYFGLEYFPTKPVVPELKKIIEDHNYLN